MNLPFGWSPTCDQQGATSDAGWGADGGLAGSHNLRADPLLIHPEAGRHPTFRPRTASGQALDRRTDALGVLRRTACGGSSVPRPLPPPAGAPAVQGSLKGATLISLLASGRGGVPE